MIEYYIAHRSYPKLPLPIGNSIRKSSFVTFKCIEAFIEYNRIIEISWKIQKKKNNKNNENIIEIIIEKQKTNKKKYKIMEIL